MVASYKQGSRVTTGGRTIRVHFGVGLTPKEPGTALSAVCSTDEAIALGAELIQEVVKVLCGLGDARGLSVDVTTTKVVY